MSFNNFLFFLHTIVCLSLHVDQPFLGLRSFAEPVNNIIQGQPARPTNHSATKYLHQSTSQKITTIRRS